MPFFNGETKMTAAAVQAKRSLMKKNLPRITGAIIRV